MSTVVLNNKSSGFFEGIWDSVKPINPVNGKREFHLIPEPLEHTLGAVVYKSTVHGSHNLSYEICKEFKAPDGRLMSFERLVRETEKKSPRFLTAPTSPTCSRSSTVKRKTPGACPGVKSPFMRV